LGQAKNVEDALSQRVMRLVQTHQEQGIMVAMALAGGHDKGAERLTEDGAIPVDNQ
jgi:ABC-type ATPase involved in cell division